MCTFRNQLQQKQKSSSDDEESGQDGSPRTALQEKQGHDVGRHLSDRGQEAVEERIAAKVSCVQGQAEISNVDGYPDGGTKRH